MDFYKIIEENGNLGLLKKVKYRNPEFYNWDSVDRFLSDIVESSHSESLRSKRVFIYGDYDVDGAMCVKIVMEGLRSVGVSGIETFRYVKRTHLLDKIAVQQCFLGGYDYFIICDTGSSDLALLNKIAGVGIKVMVFDHHETTLDYDDFNEEKIAVINTELENQKMDSGSEQFRLSAGALSYVILRKFFDSHGYEFDQSIAAYAAVSLFSDCMDMRNSLNRAIYYEARRLERRELPVLVSAFMNDYSTFCARYIGYWFAPRLNAALRSETFGTLNMLLFDDLSPVDMQYCCMQIEEIYTGNREMVKEIADIISVKELDNFILGDLYSVDKYYSVGDNKLANYTGLVANKLAEQYGKTAVVYCKNGVFFKGSVRDPFSRNYLSLFRQFCYAGGHKPAFGLKVRLFDFDDFISNIRNIDENFSINTVSNKPIIISVAGQEPDNVLLEDMASYNEFSGQHLPEVFIKKQIIGSMREIKTAYNYKYVWGGYYIQSDHQLGFGTTVLLKPVKGITTKLIVQ